MTGGDAVLGEQAGRYLTAVGVAVVAIAVLALWPRPYAYEAIQAPPTGPAFTLVRINRATGSTQEYVDGRWVGARSARLLPAKELSQLVMYAGVNPDGALGGNIYNGSLWMVTQVAIRVEAQAHRERPGAPSGPWSRVVTVHLRLLPRSTQLLHVPVTDPLEIKDRQLEFKPWAFAGAYGYPP
jgi:hypothetical protein